MFVIGQPPAGGTRLGEMLVVNGSQLPKTKLVR
jgi:hypothetical protein